MIIKAPQDYRKGEERRERHFIRTSAIEFANSQIDSSWLKDVFSCTVTGTGSSTAI